MCLLRCVYFFLLCLQLLDLFSPQKRIDALNRLQLCWTIVVDSEFVESPQSLIYYFRQAAFVLLSLRGFSYDVYCCSLGLLVEVVLPAFCQQHQLRVLPFPKLNEPVEFEPANVLYAFRIDSDRNAFFGVDEAGDYGEKGVEAVDLIEESFSISVELIEVIGGQDVHQQLVKIDASQHSLFGEGSEVVVDGFPLVEQHALEQDVAVVVGVEFFDDRAAFRVKTHPFFQNALQLVCAQRAEGDLDGHVFLHKVFQQAGSRASVYSQKISDSLGKCFQVGRCGFVLVVGVGLGESFKGYFIADLHLDGHEVFDGDVVMFIHAYFILQLPYLPQNCCGFGCAMPDEIVIRYRSMGGQENTYQHGSGEQVTFPNNQQPPAPLPSLRDNPNLLRIHADDQDKKTICIFWSLLLCLLILLAIVANFAIPSIYVRNSLSRSLSGTSLEGCANPASFSGDSLVCSSNALYFGEVVVGWTPANQFGLLYLQVRPNNMTQPIKIDQKYLLQLYSLRLRASSPRPVFQKVGRPNGVNATIQFSSDDADYIYADDGRTVVGYQYLLAIIVDFDSDPFLQQIQFSQTLPANAPIRLQSYAINSRFTVFTIVIRYFYFVLAILGCVLYFLRYLKVPAARKTIEQKMVAVASVLLIMFNDPFYPITVLKPNGASAFFSLFFIVNLITFLLLLWLVFADRIYFEDGQQETVQLTKKKVAYVGLVWIILIICLMAYTMQQVDGSPIVPHDFSRRYTAARVIIALVVLVGIVYIAIRFVKSCMAPQGRTWRSTLFMCFSSAFIVAVFIILVSNALVPYNYSGSSILVVYSLINVYIYYLQYMYAITREQADKLEHPEPVQNDNYDVITVGTIDLVDVNLDDDEEGFSNSNISATKQEKKKEEKLPFGQEDFE